MPDTRYQGQLPPGASDQLAAALADFREAEQAGVALTVQVLGPGDCGIAARLAGKGFKIKDVPALPLPGCSRLPCCACCYCPVVLESEQNDPS